ncbi:MAG TPA: maleylpyruvate isomerase N-terminal domain-containing protein [Actinomycetes bacterium]|nr:maleylpyruvate isomerase N-terminal domain-containing protein [Actinomycetes bacterium]
MTSLEYGRFCDEVANQTGLLVATVKGADLSATVPTAPDWSLSDLLRHVGGNLRSLETAVRTGEAVTEPARQIPGHGGPPGDDPAELFAWLSEAADRLAATLGAASPEVQVQMWTIRWPTAAWARRAAHDLLIHRADAAGTVGAAYTAAPDLAADALDEFLDLVSSPEVAGASGDTEAGDPGPSGTIHLHATDTGPEIASEWLVELASPTFTWRHAHEKASVAVRGPMADVLLVACRRRSPDADGIELLGDRAVLDTWLERVILR